MITHIILIEESHLFLYSSVDTRIAGMQADDEFTFVVELFHQKELFFQIHVCRTAYGSSRFGTKSEFFRDQTACI